jgi:hypothetical protein
MRIKGWLVTGAIAGGLVFAYRGCLNEQAPDEQLADHFDELCGIARRGITKPVAGVHKLGHYLNRHADDLLGDFGATLALIERIDDDGKHDDRARLARDRMQAPLVACERDWQRFAAAVEANPEASAYLDRGVRRLNRTLEILFQGRRVDVRSLPRELADALAR